MLQANHQSEALGYNMFMLKMKDIAINLYHLAIISHFFPIN